MKKNHFAKGVVYPFDGGMPLSCRSPPSHTLPPDNLLDLLKRRYWKNLQIW